MEGFDQVDLSSSQSDEGQQNESFQHQTSPPYNFLSYDERPPDWPQLNDLMRLTSIVNPPPKLPLQFQKVYQYVTDADGNLRKCSNPNAVNLTLDILHYGN